MVDVELPCWCMFQMLNVGLIEDLCLILRYLLDLQYSTCPGQTEVMIVCLSIAKIDSEDSLVSAFHLISEIIYLWAISSNVLYLRHMRLSVHYLLILRLNKLSRVVHTLHQMLHSIQLPWINKLTTDSDCIVLW
jgi:hypothetical protein